MEFTPLRSDQCDALRRERAALRIDESAVGAERAATLPVARHSRHLASGVGGIAVMSAAGPCSVVPTAVSFGCSHGAPKQS